MDSGICPWCRTIQTITSYGRQRCQVCSKPVRVEPDQDTDDILHGHAEYWNGVLTELLEMEAELRERGLGPHKMIAEVTRHIERLTIPDRKRPPRKSSQPLSE